MTTCAHHWDIAPANGPTSAGVCRNCGEARQFRNTVEQSEKSQIHFHIANQANNVLDGDIRAAKGLTHDTTRAW